MATNIFVSFRFSDGASYKKDLDELFDDTVSINNYSEDEDRSNQTEETIQKYLYSKLKETSVTVVILTPNAVSYKRNYYGQIDDWMYDELRYSLEDREDNRTNGVIALYTENAKPYLITDSTCNRCSKYCPVTRIENFENLVKKNMMNIKNQYKTHMCDGVYDDLKDSYISLIPFDKFKDDYTKYIKNALEKRDNLNHFQELTKRM